MSVVSEETVVLALAADKGDKAELVSFSCHSLNSEFDGATSNIVTVRVKYKTRQEDMEAKGEDLEVSYIAKTAADKGPQWASFFNVIHTKECLFYGQVIPALNDILTKIGQGALAFPRCYHYCTTPGQELIILENLKDKGYSMRAKRESLDPDHTRLALKELAKLHAASAILQETQEGILEDQFPCLQKEWTREFKLFADFGEFVNGSLKTTDEVFAKIGGCEGVRAWIANTKPVVVAKYEEMIERRSPFTVITHCDPYINNFMFRYDNDGRLLQMKMFDLQVTRLASLALDLQHLFNMNLDDQTRRPNLRSFLAFYHDAFSVIMEAGGCKTPFTLEALQKEYVAKGFYGVFYCLIGLPNMLRREEEFTDVLGDEEEQRASVMKMVNNNPLLVPRLMSIVDEWTEAGVIPSNPETSSS